MTGQRKVAFRNPPTIAPPLGIYSHVAVVPPGSALIVVAGQVGCDPGGAVPADPVEQYRLALANLVAILASEGAGPGHLIKLNSYLVGPMPREAMRAARRSVLGDAAPPATMGYVAGLASEEYRVEVEGWAVRPD